jgi:HSP20 family protein
MFGDGFNLGRLRGELDRLFGTYLGDLEAWRPRDGGGSPAVNLWEDESAFHAEAEVPGLRMEDLEVQVIGNELVIKGMRKAEDRSSVTYHREERGAGRFGRVIRLPAEVDAGKVQATLRDGILTITLPKAEAARPRKIDVKYAAKS